MHRRASEPRERDVAHHHQLLGLGGLTGDAETARPLPLVHVPAGGEGFVLAVLGERDAEPARVLEGAAHQRRVLHAAPVVGEQANAERRHLGHRRQAIALPADGDRASNVHVAQARLLPEIEDLVHHRGAIDRRLGVRHRDDGREASERRRSRTALDRLGLFAAGLAQVRVEIDQPRGDDAPRRVERDACRVTASEVVTQVFADRGDAAVLADQHVGAATAGLVDDPAALDDDEEPRAQPRLAPEPSS